MDELTSPANRDMQIVECFGVASDEGEFVSSKDVPKLQSCHNCSRLQKISSLAIA